MLSGIDVLLLGTMHITTQVDIYLTVLLVGRMIKIPGRKASALSLIGTAPTKGIYFRVVLQPLYITPIRWIPLGTFNPISEARYVTCNIWYCGSRTSPYWEPEVTIDICFCKQVSFCTATSMDRTMLIRTTGRPRTEILKIIVA